MLHGGEFQQAQHVAGERHAHRLVGGLRVISDTHTHLVLQQDGQDHGDEVLAVGDQREQTVDGGDLVPEPEHRGARGEHLNQHVDALLRVSGNSNEHIALLHQRVHGEQTRLSGNVVQRDHDGGVRNARLAGVQLTVVTVGVVVAAQADEMETDQRERVSFGIELGIKRSAYGEQKTTSPSTAPPHPTASPLPAFACAPHSSPL